MIAPGLPVDLAAALERAYAVFAGYRFANTVPCACCNSEQEVERSRLRLTETPLRELALGDVDYVCLEILTMWGDQADAKVLAPRLLELIAASWLLGEELGSQPSLPGFVLSDAWTLRLFAQADWLEWPAAEQEAVEACFRSLWVHLLAAPERGPVPARTEEEDLMAVLSLVRETRPYLDGFLAGPTEVRRLVWFLRAFVDQPRFDDLGVRSFDEQVEATRVAIDAWLHGDAVREALVRAIADPGSEGFRWELVLGLEQLQRPALIEFDQGTWPPWVPGAEALALAADLGVDLHRDSLFRSDISGR